MERTREKKDMEGNREKQKKDICVIVSHRFVKVRNIHRMKESCSPFPLPGQQHQTQVSKYLAEEAVIQLAKG